LKYEQKTRDLELHEDEFVHSNEEVLSFSYIIDPLQVCFLVILSW